MRRSAKEGRERGSDGKPASKYCTIAMDLKIEGEMEDEGAKSKGVVVSAVRGKDTIRVQYSAVHLEVRSALS